MASYLLFFLVSMVHFSHPCSAIFLMNPAAIRIHKDSLNARFTWFFIINVSFLLLPSFVTFDPKVCKICNIFNSLSILRYIILIPFRIYNVSLVQWGTLALRHCTYYLFIVLRLYLVVSATPSSLYFKNKQTWLYSIVFYVYYYIYYYIY